MPKILDLETEFDIFMGDVISLPPETIFFRGQDPKYPAISNRPAYFGSQDTAVTYLKNSEHSVGAFITDRPLYLVDVRYLQAILKIIIDKRSYEKEQFSISDENAILALTLSFGLSSLGHQLKLIHNFFKNNINKLPGVRSMEKLQNPKSILEQPGIRIAETTTDAFTMGFLKTLFENIFDGYFSPRLKSSFHTEKDGFLNPELIIFNPSELGIKSFHNFSKPLEKITMKSLINKQQNVLYLKPNLYQVPFHFKGGSNQKLNSKQKHILDEVDEKINAKDKDIIRMQNTGIRTGQKWAKKQISSINNNDN